MDMHNLILSRMQRLLTLGLPDQPAAELIPGTVRVWEDRLCGCDPDRLAMAFDSIEDTAKRWPTPAMIREAMPTYPHTYKAPSEPAPMANRIPVDPEQAARSHARVQKLIDDCAKSLGMKFTGDAA